MFAAATVFAYGCSDNFDDSALWKDIDGMYKSLNELKAQVTTMQQQLDALAAVVSGGAVTSITQDADGHYVLSYKDADNVEHTIDIATMDDANTIGPSPRAARPRGCSIPTAPKFPLRAVRPKSA